MADNFGIEFIWALVFASFILGLWVMGDKGVLWAYPASGIPLIGFVWILKRWDAETLD
jgi:hypothetical protein